MFNLTFEFKLKPTVAQTAVFEDWLEQCRKVYNSALKERKDWYNSRKCPIDSCSIRSEYIIPADGPLPSYSSQCKALTAYRKTSPALQRVNAAVLHIGANLLQARCIFPKIRRQKDEPNLPQLR